MEYRSRGPVRSRRRKRLTVTVLVLIPVAIWIGNTSTCVDPPARDVYLVAHRGLGQAFSREGLTGRTCTAARMIPTGHRYLENTIPAMRAAFAYGADAVEFDVHRTRDDRFAVFHDWTVACRTEGTGATGDHTLEELQRLDVGHGYTADGGATWPFRGHGVGLMPSLEDVFAAFPDGDLWIDIKSRDPSDGRRLAERLAELGRSHRGEIAVFGSPEAIAATRERLPELRTMTRPRLKRCLTRYLAFGWTGAVPSACDRGLVFVPANVAPWLWGWPDRFLRRMERAGARVVVIGEYGGEGFSRGFDDSDRLDELPEDYAGGLWTDRIDRIGPAVRSR